MKTLIKRLAVLCLGAGLVSSCYDLKSDLYDTIYPDRFPKTAEDAKALVASAYWPLRWEGLVNGLTRAIMTMDLCTDVGMTNDRQGGWVSWEECTWTATGGGGLSNSPIGQYGPNISHLSAMELNLGRVASVDMDGDLKDRYLAEIKCSQAWLAYILYDWFGPIPVADAELLLDPMEEVLISRLSDKEMVTYIETKAREAAGVLPYRYPTDADKGRYTRGMANMVLLKLYMKEKMWAEAEAMGRELMKPEYGYGLMQSYRDIFTLENEGNEEIIYALNCTQDYGQMLTNYLLPYNYPTENDKINKLNAFRSPWEFYHSFEAGDERRQLLIGEYVGTDGVLYNEMNQGSYLSGAVPHKYGEDPQCIGYGSQVDYIVFRYADALLLLAEAIANNNGAPTAEAMTLVNRVRERAGLAHKDLADYSTLEKFNELILDERGFELWWESHRRTDLIRHGKFIERAALRNPAVARQPYRVLFPIPEQYIVEGQGSIRQNEGY
ncbi:MAG: RagB/SusD family nutrient uptake outer membrane protein [Alistipes sp.]|nr:RagB/SusD family nutrient uptake outer membrane protein [Alistipes sp.]